VLAPSDILTTNADIALIKSKKPICASSVSTFMESTLEDIVLTCKSITTGSSKYLKVFSIDFIKFLLFFVLVSLYMHLLKDMQNQEVNVLLLVLEV
jgi:hypothetical protein